MPGASGRRPSARALPQAPPEAVQDAVLLDPLTEEENNNFELWLSETTGAAPADPGPKRG